MVAAVWNWWCLYNLLLGLQRCGASTGTGTGTGSSDIAQQLCWSTGACGSNGGFGPMMLMEVLEPVVLVMEVLPPNDSGDRLGLLTGTAIN